MIERLRDLVVDESKWLAASLAIALAMGAWSLVRSRDSESPWRRRIQVALNLTFGLVIGVMALGHLLAVTVRWADGTLREGSLFVFYGIGIVLAVPSWWLVARNWRARTDRRGDGSAVRLNAWTAASLVAVGPINWPLALPALLNVVYARSSRPLVGRVVLAVALLLYLALFAGSLVFFVSGQSFEEYSGMEAPS